jgi:hypothetical protein
VTIETDAKTEIVDERTVENVDVKTIETGATIDTAHRGTIAMSETLSERDVDENMCIFSFPFSVSI